MREVSFVKKLKFDFHGSVAKRALVVGDADNDQTNELVCANLQGDLAIFKDRNPDKYAFASNLGMVTACLVGDVTNSGKNQVAAINTEGWLFVFDLLRFKCSPDIESNNQFDANFELTSDADLDFASSERAQMPIELTLFHSQIVPANCKELLLADLDGDGLNEIIIGLTDRVLRTYQWFEIGSGKGKFVGLHKWEFADQIGSVSLNPSRHDNCQDIIVAQPGGTYAKLECFDKKTPGNQTPGACTTDSEIRDTARPSKLSNVLGINPDHVKTEFINKLTPEYHQLALSQMQNHQVSTEILGGIRDGRGSDLYSSIVLATLDGTLMLVNKDEILWSLQVDHQLFALALLEFRPSRRSLLSQSESTCTIVPNIGSGGSETSSRRQPSPNKRTQYFVACAWNGKTYIVDEDRNYLRFKFDEAVSAFTAGNYYFDGRSHSALVYATFNNQIVMYYDVILDNIRPVYLLNELLHNPDHQDLLGKLESQAQALGLLDNSDLEDANQKDLDPDLSRKSHGRGKVLRTFLRGILYNITDEELFRILGEKHDADN